MRKRRDDLLKITVEPQKQALTGRFHVPSDKSLSHRALMLGALAKGRSCVRNLLSSEDVKCTQIALMAMGVNMEMIENTCWIEGVGLKGLKAPEKVLDMGNSGTSLRLLTGILVAQSFPTHLVGDASLLMRPMGRITQPLSEMGANLKWDEKGMYITPVSVLHPIYYTLPVASAQVKSCLLLAGLYAEGESRIDDPFLTRDHTENMLAAMGCVIDKQGNACCVKGKSQLDAIDISVCGDISSAAFFMVAATLLKGSHLILEDVGVNPSRIGVIHLLRRMGAVITLHAKTSMIAGEPVADIEVKYAEKLTGITIYPEDIPSAIDELPIILVAAACAEGETILLGAKELTVKESDRLVAMDVMLSQLGICVKLSSDGMVLRGGKLSGGNIKSFHDHRIAMAASIAGLLARMPVTIADASCVAVSFPNFIELSQKMGLNINKYYDE